MKLGFIGLGNMGEPMAANLLKAGHELVLHDIRKEAAAGLLAAGGKWVESPAEVAQRSEMVLTSLPGPPEVERVALGDKGILSGMSRGSVYIDLSTNSPTLLKKLASVFAEKGVEMIDAPVSGGAPGAKAGTLSVMVGGSKQTFERCQSVLNCLGSNVFYVGEIGSGNKVKLINNLMGAVNLYNAIECMELAKKLDLDVRTVFDIVKVSAGNSFVFERKLPLSLLVGNFEPGFAVDVAYKDVELASQLARESGVPLTLASVVHEKLVELRGRGWGKKDWTSFAMVLEEGLGIKARFE